MYISTGSLVLYTSNKKLYIVGRTYHNRKPMYQLHMDRVSSMTYVYMYVLPNQVGVVIPITGYTKPYPGIEHSNSKDNICIAHILVLKSYIHIVACISVTCTWIEFLQ